MSTVQKRGLARPPRLVLFGQLYSIGEPPAQMADYNSCGLASVCDYVVGGALPVARCNVEHINTLPRLPEAE